MRFADRVIIWVVHLPERTEIALITATDQFTRMDQTGIITALDQTVWPVHNCNSWFLNLKTSYPPESWTYPSYVVLNVGSYPNNDNSVQILFCPFLCTI